MINPYGLIRDLTDERDRARATAAALEAENAELLKRIEVARQTVILSRTSWVTFSLDLLEALTL